MPDPSLARTIQRHAVERPSATALTMLAADGVTARDLTYRELDDAARMAAGHIRAAYVGDAPVLLLTRTDVDCVVALCGCLYAGIAFAPVPIPGRGSAPARLTAFAAATRSRLVLAPSDALPLRAALPDHRWLAFDTLDDEAPLDPRPLHDTGLAMVQFTSGSTADPKGVALSEANIVANLEMLRLAFGVDARSRYASWLPLFHDMGLAMLLMPLYFGVPGVLLPPMSFLRRPARWLRAVDRFGATITGAPNFAYDLCTSRITPDEAAALDLSRCRIAFCGAEPVRRATMAAFADRFAANGFARDALYPCYGLAEAVTFVAGGFWSPTADDMTGDVPCGRPASGSTIVVVDPETRAACADGATGEIWVAGPHVAAGYLDRPEESAMRFAATLPDHRGTTFLRTGDLGTLIDGTLTITGRIKDIIVHRGENIHAIDVEAAVGASHAGFSSVAAAFGCTIDDRECVVVVHETARRRLADLRTLRIAAEDAVASTFGVRLHDFVLVRPGALPKTTSGKVRRDEARRLYLAGAFDRPDDMSGEPTG